MDQEIEATREWMLQRNTKFRDRETQPDPLILQRKSSYMEIDRGHYPSRWILQRLGYTVDQWQRFEARFANRRKGASCARSASVELTENIRMAAAAGTPLNEEQIRGLLKDILLADKNQGMSAGHLNMSSLTPEEDEHVRDTLADPRAEDPAKMRWSPRDEGIARD